MRELFSVILFNVHHNDLLAKACYLYDHFFPQPTNQPTNHFLLRNFPFSLFNMTVKHSSRAQTFPSRNFSKVSFEIALATLAKANIN